MRWIKRLGIMLAFGCGVVLPMLFAAGTIFALLYEVGNALVYGVPDKANAVAMRSAQPVRRDERLEGIRAAMRDVQVQARKALLESAKGQTGMARDYLCAGVTLLRKCEVMTVGAISEYQLLQAGQCMDGLDYDRVVLQYSPAIGCGGN